MPSEPTDYLRVLCRPETDKDGKILNERQILNAADVFFREADQEKARHDRNFPLWYSSVSGRLWREELLRKLPLDKGKKVQTQSYYIGSNYSGWLIRRLVGWLIPRRPYYYAQAEGLEDYDLPLSLAPEPPGVEGREGFNEWISQRSDVMELILRAAWTEGKYGTPIGRALHDMATFGVGILKSYIDETTYKPMLTDVPVWNVLVDPVASSNDDAWGFIEASVVQVVHLAHLGPKVVDIKPEVDNRASYTSEDAELLNRGRREVGGAVGAGTEPSSAPSDQPSKLRNEREKLPQFSDKVLRKDFWIRDPSRKSWHHYVIAGGQLLDYSEESYLPYVDLRWLETEHYWGMGAAGVLYPIEAAIERVLSLLLNSIRLTMFPTLVYSFATFGGKKNIVALPGQSLVTAPGREGEVRWMQPPTVPPYVDQYLNFLINYGPRLIGLDGLMAAQAQGRGTPVGVVSQLAENSTVDIRAVASRINGQLETLLRHQTCQVAESNAAFFTSYAIPPGMDAEGNRLLQLAPGFFELPILGEMGERVPKRLRFAVFLEVGSVLSRAAQKEDMMWLVDKGFADADYAYEVTDTPGSHALAQRMADKAPASVKATLEAAQAAGRQHKASGPDPQHSRPVMENPSE